MRHGAGLGSRALALGASAANGGLLLRPASHEWHGQPESVRENPVANEAWKALALTEANVAADTLFSHLSELWPGFGTPVGTGQVLHWNILNDPLNRKGEQRRRAQYLRANIDPHERCTLALPGESENRIRPDATGFANLTVAGDWTANDILAACFEGGCARWNPPRRAPPPDPQRPLLPSSARNLLNPGPRLPPRGAEPASSFRSRPPASSAPPSLQPQAGPGVGPTDANPSLGAARSRRPLSVAPHVGRGSFSRGADAVLVTARTRTHRRKRRMGARAPSKETFDCAVVVWTKTSTGFTPLVERLSDQGSGGAERGSGSALSAHFGRIIDICEEYGGDLLFLAGDAALCLFRRLAGENSCRRQPHAGGSRRRVRSSPS